MLTGFANTDSEQPHMIASSGIKKLFDQMKHSLEGVSRIIPRLGQHTTILKLNILLFAGSADANGLETEQPKHLAAY
jgi:hypothetical protein